MSETQNPPIDTRDLSRRSSTMESSNVDHYLMGVEVGSLQRIADSLERLEVLAYTGIKALDKIQPGQIPDELIHLVDRGLDALGQNLGNEK